MTRPDPASVKHIALLGTGTIGASWATYFLSRGFSVAAWDPAPDTESRLRTFIDTAWPAMTRIGIAPDADATRLLVVEDPCEAIEGAIFVQENAPEDIDLKRDLYGRIDTALPADAIVSSSSSGLLVSELQQGFASGARFMVGHPFNPPHLVPLVEVVGGSDTDPAAVDWAVAFYNAHGKHAIRINRELPGHIANRLQAAMQREAFHLMLSGAASAADIDAAITYGPGLRWAFMGPFLTMHLAGGDGGAQHALEHFGPALERWWADFGTPRLDSDAIAALARGVEEAIGTRSITDLAAERDERLLALLEALQSTATPANTD